MHCNLYHLNRTKCTPREGYFTSVFLLRVKKWHENGPKFRIPLGMPGPPILGLNIDWCIIVVGTVPPDNKLMLTMKNRTIYILKPRLPGPEDLRERLTSSERKKREQNLNILMLTYEFSHSPLFDTSNWDQINSKLSLRQLLPQCSECSPLLQL